MTNAARKIDADELNIPDVARDILAEASGDVLKATELMEKRVRKNPSLYRPLMDPLVRNACYEAISQICRQQRKAIWHTQQPSAEESRSRVVALAGGTMSTLMDFPLPGGMRLADAKREDVTAAADFYGKQAKDMGHKSHWLRLIAQHVPAEKKVSEVLDQSRLEELRDEASHAE